MAFNETAIFWLVAIGGFGIGALLLEMGFRHGRRGRAVLGMVVVTLVGSWATAHARAQDPAALGADIQAIIAQSTARAEKASETLRDFAKGAEVQTANPYQADAAKLARENTARVREGMGMIDSKLFGQDVSGHLAPAVSDGAFYVAVSLTMPVEALRELSRDVGKAGGKLVIRGLVNNSFPQTLTAARRIFDQKSINGIAIEPQVFRAFKVQTVPVFITAQEPVQPCTGGVDCTSEAPAFDKIAGNISTGEALRQLASRGTGAPKVAREALAKLEAR